MDPLHPDWLALRAAVAAHPDDDTPRLVAADFLDEHGAPERAELIRAQIATARMYVPDAPDALDLNAYWRAANRLIGPRSPLRARWALAECPELVRAVVVGNREQVRGADQLEWHRGFVEKVTCPAADWLRVGAAVRARNPIRDVHLEAWAHVPAEQWVAGLDALRGLTDLTVPTNGPLFDWLREVLPGTRLWDIPF